MAKARTKCLISLLFLVACSSPTDATITHIAAQEAFASSKIDIHLHGVDTSMVLSFVHVDGSTFATLHSPMRQFYRKTFPLVLDGKTICKAIRRKGKYIAKLESAEKVIAALLEQKDHTLSIGIEQFSFTTPNLAALLEESKKKHTTYLEF